jgi:hypothetical protein
MRIPVANLMDGNGDIIAVAQPKAKTLPKTKAPTSGAVPNFTPTVSIPQPAVQAGQKGFVGPVATTVQTGTTVNTSNMGPQGGLAAGVVAGVTGPSKPTWTKTGTVETAYGPVDVDANGVAENGSVPIAFTKSGGENNSIWTKAGTVQTAGGPVDVDANGLAQDGSKPVAANTTTVGETPTLVDTIIDDYGNSIGIYSDGSRKTLISSGRTYRTTVDEDAYAIIQKTLEDNGLASLVSVVQGYMDRGLGSNQAALELRKEPAYQKRFAGNEARRKAGLNVLSEAEYLGLEDSYMNTLKRFGIANELGTDLQTRQANMANLISGNVDAIEFKDRVDAVVTRVKNADKTTKDTFGKFFGIKDEDLISYFLNPKDNLPKLQEKVTAAEIGAAAITQDLATNKDAAIALAQLGITRESARAGYESIGEVLPTGKKLGEIYGDQYTQQTAEQEVFQGLASAKRKRQQLAEREVASFSGSSGRLRTGRAQGNTGEF